MFDWNSDTQLRGMAEHSGAVDGAMFVSNGLLAKTRIATSMGWRPAEALAAGDMVLTFDNGLQKLVEVRRETCWFAHASIGEAALIRVPAGALGNCVDTDVLPDQGILIESEAACDAHGDPFAMVKARALVGFRGIHRAAPPPQMEVITLIFEDEEIVYAEGGILLHCPRAVVLLDAIGQTTPGYDVVADREAAFLVECMAIEAQGGTVAPMTAAA